MIDAKQRVHLLVGQRQARNVDRRFRRHAADGGVDGLRFAFETVDNVFQDARVLAEARPDELAVLVFPEPVDEEDLRQLRAGLLADLQPVREVVGHVVAGEGQHRERIAAKFAHLVLGGSGAFRGDRRAHEHAVLPVVRFRHQRHSRRAAAAEQDGGDRNAGLGSSHSAAITGHCSAGQAKRALG